MSTRNYLSSVRSLRMAPTDFAHAGMEDFILRYGMDCPVGPKSHRRGGIIKECYKNAYELVVRKKDLFYVEGWAMGSILPVAHAWTVDRNGIVVDNTWARGCDYVGVPFDFEFVLETVAKNNRYGIIDDWENGWPLVRLPLNPSVIAAPWRDKVAPRSEWTQWADGISESSRNPHQKPARRRRKEAAA